MKKLVTNILIADVINVGATISSQMTLSAKSSKIQVIKGLSSKKKKQY